MKALFLSILGALSLFGMVIVALWVVSHSERPRSFFTTYADVEKSGIFARGWLPEYLPRSARKITEQHDLDTNEVWASFEFDRNDIASVSSKCKLTSDNSSGRKFICPPFGGQTAQFLLRHDGVGYYSREQDS